MKLDVFHYQLRDGWSVAPFPDYSSYAQTLVLAFASPSLRDQDQVWFELAQAYPHALIAGCSTAGEILGTRLLDDSIVVAVLGFERTALATAYATVYASAESYDAGRMLAQQLLAPALRGVLVFSDGTLVNGSALVQGLNSVLPATVVTTGGLAGDGPHFKSTWVLHNTRPAEHGIVAIGLYGTKVEVRHGSKGGWEVFGPEHRVTKATANVLYELDGQPALKLYKTYLGDLAKKLPASALLFPLALRDGTDMDSEKIIVRTILSVNEAERSMTFAGDVPAGARVQLMRADFEHLISAATEAGGLAGGAQAAGEPMLSIAISCVGRRLILNERTEDELQATLNALPPRVQQIGFYSYGEISPYALGQCDLHNQTMTLTTIAEAA